MNTNAALLAGTRLINSGLAIAGSILTSTLSAFTCNVSLITTLAAGNQIFGIVAAVVLLGEGLLERHLSSSDWNKDKKPQKGLFLFHH
ncbi:hypothetical protein [Bacillus sp. FSL K6-0923]|uniref:hypothetical protein n=1 Tax=Bacillus TaxID=1386 RepID=UPI00315A9D4A